MKNWFTISSITACTLNYCMNGGTPDTTDCTICMCPTGFTGTQCETNIDDCATNPCVNGNCTDETGGYTCVCDSLWTGTNCDTCLIPNCAQCNSNVNPPTCQVCNTGFKLPFCVPVCSPSPCQNGGTCTLRGLDGFTCMCPRGWTGDTCTKCAEGFGMLNSECGEYNYLYSM